MRLPSEVGALFFSPITSWEGATPCLIADLSLKVGFQVRLSRWEVVAYLKSIFESPGSVGKRGHHSRQARVKSSFRSN